MEMFYDMVRNMPRDTFSPIISVWGEGTEYEAVARVDVFDGMWDGFLVFKDIRFSPLELEHVHQLQFKHLTPSAGNGVLAEFRAKETWQTLVTIFKSLSTDKDATL